MTGGDKIMGTVTTLFRKQRTVRSGVSYSGIGLHTGELVTLRLCPAPANTGIVFQRHDLPHKPRIPATVDHILDTSRSTTLGVGDAQVHTVEHVLAAIRAYDLDNVIVEIDGIEPPVGDGSSKVFVEMIEESGVEEQSASIAVRRLKEPVYYSEGDIHLIALPSEEGFKVSYTLNYPNSELLKAQYYTFDLSPEAFKTDVAPCRSFGLYHEIGPLLDRGLIKGCSLANAVVIKDDVVFSKGGLVFPDEMVRHKVLDLIGDISLVGFPFQAHIVAIRSGHATHKIFSRKLYKAFMMMEKLDGQRSP